MTPSEPRHKDPGSSAVGLLQRLVRFDTSNPPGNEAACIAFIGRQLEDAGLETVTLAADPTRPNLVARLRGRDEAPPLLLYGHVDVVPAAHSAWTHPPFSGAIADGCVWGRGALDMKGGLAMMIASLQRIAESGTRPAGDILFAAVADEEAGGTVGARFLVEQHAERFAGVRHAVGEFGAFPLRVGSRTVYAVQVAEKSPCLATVTVRGAGGHGARITRGQAMAQLAALLRRLDRKRFPIQRSQATARMVRAMATATPGLAGWALRGLLVTPLAGALLHLLGPSVEMLEPLFRNTATPTVVNAGGKANVVPSSIDVTLDCRLLPGTKPETFLRQLRGIIGPFPEVRLDCLGDAPDHVDLSLLPTLSTILAERTGGAPTVPLLLPASTDARFLARLGIQSYGFTPMDLPPSFPFFEMIHAANERIPIHCLEFGTECMLELIRRYGDTADAFV